MASIKDYLTTAKDIVTGKQSIGDAISAGQRDKGGVLYKSREGSGGGTGKSKNSGGGSSDNTVVQSQPSYSPSSGRSLVSSGGSSSKSKAIDDAEDAQKEAAEKAEEEARQAAKRAYEAKADAARDAKVSAKGQYDWLIDTLGSNKQDLLDEVTTNLNEGLTNYDVQGKQTTEKYDAAKQEILSTYRDLQTQQEKIMRGAGMGQSSRSMEAQLRLNNLMGKDLGSVSKNEADSLALIGNAVTTLKQRALDTQNSIERETKSKLDKAALDYNDQITAIDNNLQLSANEKADAYAAAETQLARDTAAITSWAANLKVQAEETMANNKALLDGYITDMTDAKGLLNSGLDEKTAATNDLLTQAGYTPLSQNAEDTNNQAGKYQKVSKKYNSIEELQNAIANGEITNQSEIEQQYAALTATGGSAMADASTDALYPKKKSLDDPLLAAIYA